MLLTVNSLEMINRLALFDAIRFHCYLNGKRKTKTHLCISVIQSVEKQDSSLLNIK